MKRLFIIIMAAVAVINISVFQIGSAFAGQEAKAGKVIAYYFHSTSRCPTCHKLEEYSKEAIETNFKDALISGKLEFRIVNVESRGNEHFVKDYQLYTKSLVLSLIKEGKEVKSENLAKIWEYVGNKQEFIDYVKKEITVFLGKS
ncbi:MAG: nitrophenyl compound nitroreductase subunit ArsF family protein [Candidatus Omnitrophica bacterium]|nr:nitrophenyl compound nitroreductase subunit ArsF family protein [Candidatus Omnitrophota bacterium]